MNLSTMVLMLVMVLKMVVGLVPHRVLGTSLGMDSGHTDVVGYLTGSFDGPALHTLVVPAWQQEGQHQQRNWPQTKPQPHAWQYGDDQSSTIIDSLNPSDNTESQNNK